MASFLTPRRGRILVLGALTVAFHYLTIDWVATHIGPIGAAAPPPPPAAMTAQLRLALPAAAPAAPRPIPPTPPKSTPPAPPKPAPASRPEPVADPAPAADPAPEAETAAPAGPAMPSMPSPASAGEAASAESPETTDGAPGGKVRARESGSVRRYNVDPPPPAEFDFDVQRVDADGTKWSGEAAMSWRRAGERYKLTVEVGLNMLITRLNLLVLSSEGKIDDYGIAPDDATEKRKGRSSTATHFNRARGQITFSASEASFALRPGTQDKASLPFQLAGIGRADVNQLGGDIDILVGEDKEATVFRFKLVGEEELLTKMGRLVTWHLSRPPKEGSYSARLDVWLAPSLDWYPVQIRNTEANGALTTQTVSKISH